MIIIGIVLLLLAYLLPDFIPVPPNIDHALSVLGWLALVVGLVLLVLSLLGRPLGGVGPVRNGRRYWY